MVDFINSLISRHGGSASRIKPYVRSRFELVSAHPETDSDINFILPETLPQEQNPPQTSNTFQSREKLGIVSEMEVGNATKKATDKPLSTAGYSQADSNAFSQDQFNSATQIVRHAQFTSRFPDIPEENKLHFANASIEKRQYGYADSSPENTAEATSQGVIAKQNPIPFTTAGQDNVHERFHKENAVNDELDKASQTSSAEIEHGRFGLMRATGFERTQIDSHKQVTAEQHPYQPTIKVTIGRIEVKAIVQSTPAAAVKTHHAVKPRMSLEDYMRQRNKRD